MPTFTVTPPRAELAALAGLPGPAEVLLEHAATACTGTLDDTGLMQACETAHAMGLCPVLTWDVLVDDAALQAGGALLHRIDLRRFAAVRVQDVGVGHYVRTRFPDMPLHLILEAGNHNLPGIQAWVRALQPQRVVLSNELPIDLVRTVAASVDVAVEIAVLGRLLIFYSPRPLVQAAEGGAMDAVRRRYAVEEGKGKTFPILENRHGTFMYYEKDLNVLPWLDEAADAGVTHARLDFKFFGPEVAAAAIAFLNGGPNADIAPLKGLLSPRQTRGFFKSNRTDKQFVKLTNPNLLVRETQPLLATVLESAKKEGYTALQTTGQLAEGDTLHMVIPEGDTVTHEVAWIRRPDGERVPHAAQPGLWLINHARRASPGTRVYRDPT